MWGRAGLGAALVWGLMGLASVAAAQDDPLYRWTDADGVVRYTPDASRVPVSARGTLEVVEAPEPAAAEPGSNGAPVAPGALPAVMGRKLPEGLIRPEVAPLAEGLEARIAELREAIRRDQRELQQLVAARGEAPQEEAAELDDHIAVLANRLPGLQAELARLERQRLGAPEP